MRFFIKQHFNFVELCPTIGAIINIYFVKYCNRSSSSPALASMLILSSHSSDM